MLMRLIVDVGDDEVAAEFSFRFAKPRDGCDAA